VKINKRILDYRLFNGNRYYVLIFGGRNNTMLPLLKITPVNERRDPIMHSRFSAAGCADKHGGNRGIGNG
jgi:hypothetical protein